MTSLIFENQPVALTDGDTVLDALLRAGHKIPYGCRAGACQSCLLQLEAGELPAVAQVGLTNAQKILGYFLSCTCKPSADSSLVVRQSTTNLKKTATLVHKEALSEHVFQLRLQTELDYFPGQYVTLWRNEYLARSYSLASLPNADNVIELHVKRIANGAFSRWACDEFAIGESLQIQNAMGKCFYTGDGTQPILLVGLGTGLAPLYGILRDALAKGQQAPIHLYAGASDANDCYLINELIMLANQYPLLTVTFLALTGARPQVVNGNIYQLIQQQFPSLKGFKVFLCGAESFVRKLKKQCFIAGANMADIATDTFLPFTPK